MSRHLGLALCSALVFFSATSAAQVAPENPPAASTLTPAPTQPSAAAPAAPAPASPPAAPAPAVAAPAPAVAAPAPGPAVSVAASAAVGSPPSAAVDAPLSGFETEEEAAHVGAGVDPHAQNSWLGSTGGLHVIDGRSGEAGTLRLQLGFDYFRVGDFLLAGDTDAGLTGMLSLHVTPIEQFEIFAALSSHSNSNNMGNPVLLQVAGDVVLGAKGWKQLSPWLSVGAEGRLLLLNTVGDIGLLFAGTSLGLRALATADLRHAESHLPLILRGNLGYLLDNSSAIVERVESRRYETLPAITRRDMANEDRHLINRLERFGLGINRVDMVQLGLGVEGTFSIAGDFHVNPLLEWTLGIPVNRQGYSCLSVPTDGTNATPQDGCLAIQGLAAAPSTLSLGVRVEPPIKGVSALLALDIGVLGTSVFVRELAPNRPWAIVLAVGYAIDTRPAKPQVHYVKVAPKNAPPPPPSNKRRIAGIVLERGFGTAVAGAAVNYQERSVNAQLTGPDGRFISYEFDPGEVVIEVTHPDYEAGRCAATIPAPSGAAARPAAFSGLVPAAAAGGGGAAAAAPDAPVEVRCELVARPKNGGVHGSVTQEKGAPVSGVTVDITGPAVRSVVTDAGGSFSAEGLPAGEYVARIDAPNFLLKAQSFTLSGGGDASVLIQLVARPKTSQVQMTPHEVKIRTQIMFKSNSAEIDERSTGLLSEIADTLQRNPQAAHVQVQGHTDNRGDSAANLALSQSRAEAVVQWLVNAGVDASRLEAKGFGDARPIVPNLTPGNRAQNRRVQFIIKDEKAQ